MRILGDAETCVDALLVHRLEAIVLRRLPVRVQIDEPRRDQLVAGVAGFRDAGRVHVRDDGDARCLERDAGEVTVLICWRTR